MSVRLKSAFTALVLGALAAGCATGPGDRPAAEVADTFRSFEATDVAALEQFDTVYLAPIQFSEDVRTRAETNALRLPRDVRPLGQRDLDYNSGRLTDELTADLAEVVTLAPAPGPGVLTIEVTITDLESNMPTQAELGANPGLSIESRYAGRAAADVVFSSEGEILGRASDSYTGTLDDRLVRNPPWFDANRFYFQLSRKVADLVG